MTWYKQDKGAGFQYLGHLNTRVSFSTEDMKDRISLAGDGRSFSNVSLSNLVAGDSGVYFCAVVHSVVSSSSAATKTYLCGRVGAKILVEDTISTR